METHFTDIKTAYDGFYKILLKNGQLPMKDTGIGTWGVSVSEEIFELFKRTGLKNNLNFIDLGSGDGKVSMIASLFTNSTGIEYDSWLHSIAGGMKKRLSHIPTTSNVRFVQGDYHQHKLNNYDVLFMHPDQKLKGGMVDKLIKECDGSKLLVHGNIFLPTQFESKTTHEINGTIYHEFQL